MSIRSSGISIWRKLLTLSALFGVSSGLAVGTSHRLVQAGEIVRASSRSCVPIGRIVLSWDSGIRRNSWVCENDLLRVGQNLRVDLLCLNQRSVIRLRGGDHRGSFVCENISTALPRKCSQSSQLICTRIRGDNDGQTTPWLQRPFGNTLVSTPTRLKWQRVPQADTYRIYIEGEGNVWQHQVMQPSLNLSLQPIRFNSEGTYLVTIVALAQDQPLGKSTQALNLISESRFQLLQEQLVTLQMRSDSITEQAHHMMQLYWQEGMYEQALQQLQSLLSQHPNSPELLMLLGDRYVDVGDLSLARQTYQHILVTQSNVDIRRVAQVALERISRGQQAYESTIEDLNQDSKMRL